MATTTMIKISCREVSEMFSRGDFEQSSRIIQWRVRWHLVICRNCQNYLRQMKIIGQATRQWAQNKKNSARIAALKKRLLNNLGIT